MTSVDVDEMNQRITHYSMTIPDTQLREITLDEFPDTPSSSFTPADSSEDEQHRSYVSQHLHCLRWFMTLFFDKSIQKEQMISITNANIHTLRKSISQAIACYDESPLTGRRHIHLAIIFKSEMTFETLQRIFGPNNHFECITGSWNGVVSYILGPPPKECFLKINTGMSEFPKRKKPQEAVDIIEKQGNLAAMKQYKTTLHYIKQTRTPSINPPFRLKIFICGAPGTGKTYLAHELCILGHRTSLFTFSPSGQLVGGQDNAEVALFDDLNLSNQNIPRKFLLQLFDIHELKIDLKGTTLKYSPKLVIITRREFPLSFQSYFGWSENDIKQFAIRMDFIIRITVVGKQRQFLLVDNQTWSEIPIRKETLIHCIRSCLD